MPHKALKALPAFKTEAEERAFWKTHDATDYLDLLKAQRVTFANLKPSTQNMTLATATPHARKYVVPFTEAE